MNSNTQGDNSTNTQINVVINSIIMDSEQLGEALRGMMGEDSEVPPNALQVIADRVRTAFVNQGIPNPARAPPRPVAIPLLGSSAEQRRAIEVLPDDAVEPAGNDARVDETMEVQEIAPAAPPPNVPEAPSSKNDGIVPLQRDRPSTSSNESVREQMTGRKRRTNDHLEDLAPPVKLASGAVAEEALPRHRVMLVNFQSAKPYTCHSLEARQQKYGYTFDKVRSNPETSTFFVVNSRFVTHFSIASDEEMANIRRVLETEETKNFTWIHKFAVQRMQKPRAFFCPMVMNNEELMRCTVVATKAYMEKRKGNEVGAMDLDELMNSSELLKNAMECPETMKQLDEGLNKKGKAILRDLVKKCTDTR